MMAWLCMYISTFISGWAFIKTQIWKIESNSRELEFIQDIQIAWPRFGLRKFCTGIMNASGTNTVIPFRLKYWNPTYRNLEVFRNARR